MKKYQLWSKWKGDTDFKFEKDSDNLKILLEAKDKLQISLPVEIKILKVQFDEVYKDDESDGSLTFVCVDSRTSSVEVGRKLKGVFVTDKEFRVTKESPPVSGSHGFYVNQALPIDGHLWKWKVVKDNHEDLVFTTEKQLTQINR